MQASFEKNEAIFGAGEAYLVILEAGRLTKSANSIIGSENLTNGHLMH